MTTGPDNRDQVRMVIDETRCIGGGLCEMSEQESFLLDDDTVIASLLGDGLLPRDRALLVADQCPGRAIGYIEINDGFGA